MGGVRGNCRNCCIVHRRLLRNNFLGSSGLKATKVGGSVHAMVLNSSTKSHKVLRRSSRGNAQIPEVLQTPLRVGPHGPKSNKRRRSPTTDQREQKLIWHGPEAGPHKFNLVGVGTTRHRIRHICTCCATLRGPFRRILATPPPLFPPLRPDKVH